MPAALQGRAGRTMAACGVPLGSEPPHTKQCPLLSPVHRAARALPPRPLHVPLSRRRVGPCSPGSAGRPVAERHLSLKNEAGETSSSVRKRNEGPPTGAAARRSPGRSAERGHTETSVGGSHSLESQGQKAGRWGPGPGTPSVLTTWQGEGRG